MPLSIEPGEPRQCPHQTDRIDYPKSIIGSYCQLAPGPGDPEGITVERPEGYQGARREEAGGDGYHAGEPRHPSVARIVILKHRSEGIEPHCPRQSIRDVVPWIVEGISPDKVPDPDRRAYRQPEGYRRTEEDGPN